MRSRAEWLERAQSGRERGGRGERASTRKDASPEACQASAFTSFATPVPLYDDEPKQAKRPETQPDNSAVPQGQSSYPYPSPRESGVGGRGSGLVLQVMVLMGLFGRDAPPDSRLPTPEGGAEGWWIPYGESR